MDFVYLMGGISIAIITIMFIIANICFISMIISETKRLKKEKRK